MYITSISSKKSDFFNVLNLPGLIHWWFNMEASHSGNISRCVQEILFSSFAVQTYGHELSFVFFHH